MKPSRLPLLRQVALDTSSQCIRCQLRTLHSTRILTSKIRTLENIASGIGVDPKPAPSAQHYKPQIEHHTPGFKPAPLGRPIGWPAAPQPTDNLDTRTLEQKRADFRNWDKHLERRRQLVAQYARPYFRDWTNMKYSRGKIWVANPRLWRKEASFWMPNFWGKDLGGELKSSVAIAKGKVTVCCVMSRTWAGRQVETFVTPEVLQIVRESGGKAQVLDLNVEEAPLFRFFLWLYTGRIKKEKSEPFLKYLLLKDIQGDIRELLGMLNHRAGYVFLLDSDCKIRWAGSGDAQPEEVQSLISGLKKLIEEKAGENGEKKHTSRLRTEKLPKQKMAVAA